jgi:cell division protein FtsB
MIKEEIMRADGGEHLLLETIAEQKRQNELLVKENDKLRNSINELNYEVYRLSRNLEKIKK